MKILLCSAIFTVFVFVSDYSITSDGLTNSNLIAAIKLSSNELQASNGVLAVKNGFRLTEKDFQKAIQIELILNDHASMSAEDKKTLKQDLIDEFKLNPKDLLNELTEVYAEVSDSSYMDDVNSLNGSKDSTDALSKSPSVSSDFTKESNLGHQYALQTVENFYRSNGLSYEQEMSFGVAQAEKLRRYIKNSQLSYTSPGVLGTAYRRYDFCTDGTFVYHYSSATSIDNYSGNENLYSAADPLVTLAIGIPHTRKQVMKY